MTATINTPVVVHERFSTAVVHLTVPVADMAKRFGPAVAELLAELKVQGVSPAGPLVAYHFNLSSADFTEFDFELGFPVDVPVRAKGRIKPSELPSVRALQTIYHGAYDGLPAAWREFQNWIAQSGHTQGLSLFERYVVGPANSADPSTWRTELTRFLA